MADNLIHCWESGEWEDVSDPNTPHESNRLTLNCDKAHAQLEWRSALSIFEALQMTVDWYKKYYASPGSHEMYSFCLEQIAAYEEIQKSRGGDHP